jgi:hypothetical protein
MASGFFISKAETKGSPEAPSEKTNKSSCIERFPEYPRRYQTTISRYK